MTKTLDEMRRERRRTMDRQGKKRRLLAEMRGEPTGLTDAAPIRVRTRALVNLGWSLEAIIAASRCPATASGLRLIVNGTHAKAERKFNAVAAMPLTLHVPAHVPDTCLVPSLGATRRIRALMALGWRHEDISPLIGRSSHHLSSGRYPKMLALDWRLVDAAYQKLSGTPGGSERARSRAVKAGFAPPAAWDHIDAPDEKPQGMERREIRGTDEGAVERRLSGEDVRMSPKDREEIVRRLHAAKLSDPAIAARIGMSDRTVLRIRQRLGLPAVYNAAGEVAS